MALTDIYRRLYPMIDIPIPGPGAIETQINNTLTFFAGVPIEQQDPAILEAAEAMALLANPSLAQLSESERAQQYLSQLHTAQQQKLYGTAGPDEFTRGAGETEE